MTAKIISPFSFRYTRSNAGLSLTEALNINPNQVIWLVGNSGSGKSTFLHLLKGFYPEFLTGELNGENPEIFKDAAYIAQNPLSQIVHERVGEEFFFSMENAAWTDERMQQARKWLSRFGLNEQEFAPTTQLSHGLSQRLLLASMLAFEPSWIVFDEPTAFLNPTMREEFYAMLESLKGQIGMLLIDHHAHAAQFADICWHVADDGVISEISVEQWLAQQAAVLALEKSAPNAFWTVPRLAESVQLTAKKLVIGYPNTPLFTANFTLNSGDCAVLVGANGTGKSTLFNTLAGVQKPLSGKFELTINGQNTLPTSQMAYVFQHPDSHFFFDTIAEELTQLGVDDIEHALAQIGLEGRGQASPHQLSEGQKRRLTLLYPCLQQRPLVLLDEPTFGQDAINTERIIRLIQLLKQAGHALIVIAHDTEVQDAIATHVWHIHDGELIT